MIALGAAAPTTKIAPDLATRCLDDRLAISFAQCPTRPPQLCLISLLRRVLALRAPHGSGRRDRAAQGDSAPHRSGGFATRPCYPMIREPSFSSGAWGIRTPDPLLAKQVLYQLS